MAKIDDLTFGSVLVEGKKHHRDILIFADGIVNKRKSGLDAVARPDELAEQKTKAAALIHITC